MPSPKPIILRFESKDGQFRLTVDPNEQLISLLSRVGTGPNFDGVENQPSS